jgi:hypothetical protein
MSGSMSLDPQTWLGKTRKVSYCRFLRLFGEGTGFHRNSLERGLGLGCCTYLAPDILFYSITVYHV